MSGCDFAIFPCDILGQVWYLTVLLPDLCVVFLTFNDGKGMSRQAKQTGNDLEHERDSSTHNQYKKN